MRTEILWTTLKYLAAIRIIKFNLLCLSHGQGRMLTMNFGILKLNILLKRWIVEVKEARIEVGSGIGSNIKPAIVLRRNIEVATDIIGSSIVTSL